MKVQIAILLLLLSLLVPMPNRADAVNIVNLNTATAVYDAPGAGALTVPVVTRADGLTFNITFTPTAADLLGRVLLMEVGGESNGTALQLINGVPTFYGKMNSTGTTAVSLPHDSSFDPSGTIGGTIGVAYSGGPLTAGVETTVAVIYNPSADVLQLAVDSDLNIDPFVMTGVGTRDNWEGNRSFAVKTRVAGDGGMDNGVTPASLAGSVAQALYWNDTGSFNSALNVVTDIIGDDVNDNSEVGSLTKTLVPGDADGFIPFATSLDDFLEFNFDVSGMVINKAWIEMDLTDDDNIQLTLADDDGTLIGTLLPTAGNQGTPGVWRAIGEKLDANISGGSGPSGNQDYRLMLPTSLFADMQATGSLTVDGSWSSIPGGVWGSNRARLIILAQTIPEPSTAVLGLIGLAGLMVRRRRAA